MVIKLGRITVVSCVLMFYIQVMAQAPIDYNTTTLGSLSPDMPIAIYTFQGNADDQITVQAIALDDELELAVTIQRGVDTMTVSSHDPFTLNSNDARIDYRIPTTATYLILVASPNEQMGDFALKLSHQLPDNKTVVMNEPVSVSIVGDEVHYLQFSSDDDELTTIHVMGNAPFYATVYDNDGTIIHQTRGRSAVIQVDDNDAYDVALRSVDPATSVTITVARVGVGSASSLRPTDELTPTPLTIITPVRTPVVESDIICEVFSDGFPNVRIAPNTFDSIITQIQPDDMYRVVGIYNEWFQVLVPTSPFGSGWVRGDVVGINGYCEEIPSVSPFNTPVIPSHTPTPTPTSTNTPVISPTPTATYTPTATPTITNTPLPTDTPSVTPTTSVQIAPTDADLNIPLNVSLGATLSVINFVSFPEGDRQDRVQWDVTGLESDRAAHLVITATCFGNGTEHVEFLVGNQMYGCGDTLVDADVTDANKTGVVTITAVAGDETYVQWVLTGEATGN